MESVLKAYQALCKEFLPLLVWKRILTGRGTTTFYSSEALGPEVIRAQLAGVLSRDPKITVYNIYGICQYLVI